VKIDKELMDFTEKCLRNYHVNLKELEERREYIRSLAVKSSSDFSDTYNPSVRSTVSQLELMVERLDNDGQLARLEKRTKPITQFLSMLSNDDRNLIEMRYFMGMGWYRISDELHVSESTLKKRWRPRLICKAASLIFGRLV
jgi:RinA family phage transcriptional activator